MKKIILCLSLTVVIFGGAALSQSHNTASGSVQVAELPVGG
ncbi:MULTISPECIES: PhrK family phosphatase-inhibitory pheromone [Bacillus]|uniref:Phosphatase n=1 Tax=Bacillus glycinifermentans TaxID=1664069 RepID=A0AAJ3YWC2_9BACI|nr:MULTISPECIES: PhrK family phosphatase-inhibitory pheromone [Bacillus]MBU8786639.1 PhrK family phosphatase-inhibitory pheromone [Bacillus glycinifermentans]MDU0070479.1 PhrK family phosphatase-inhibitory pheromone [Bacillus sp. IG6]MED8018344.1 PhrK family phosphatase-inhibitory pheromone [Bacillus glycinifermentans]NUJ16558.1 phosphatase [Bacillus glycinifermentans]QAT64206.1 phosphatase [Bacillus glycinifermentans]